MAIFAILALGIGVAALFLYLAKDTTTKKTA